jgi:hypothetical protein
MNDKPKSSFENAPRSRRCPNLQLLNLKAPELGAAQEELNA